MKSYGKVIEYDGYTGANLGVDGNKYLMLSTEILDNDIGKDDYVSFDAEVYKDVEFTKHIARFIKRVNKEDMKN